MQNVFGTVCEVRKMYNQDRADDQFFNGVIVSLAFLMLLVLLYTMCTLRVVVKTEPTPSPTIERNLNDYI